MIFLCKVLWTCEQKETNAQGDFKFHVYLKFYAFLFYCIFKEKHLLCTSTCSGIVL